MKTTGQLKIHFSEKHIAHNSTKIHQDSAASVDYSRSSRRKTGGEGKDPPPPPPLRKIGLRQSVQVKREHLSGFLVSLGTQSSLENSETSRIVFLEFMLVLVFTPYSNLTLGDRNLSNSLKALNTNSGISLSLSSEFFILHYNYLNERTWSVKNCITL